MKYSSCVYCRMAQDTRASPKMHQSESTNSVSSLNIDMHKSDSSNLLCEAGVNKKNVRAARCQNVVEFLKACAQTKYVVASFLFGYVVGFLCATAILWK